MKKLNILLCILIGICLIFSGCGKGLKPDKLLITATNFAEYDFARAVAGDRCEIKMLIPPGRDMHSFEPTAADILSIENSSLFIYIGGESDSFVDKILDSVKGENLSALKMSDFVCLTSEEHHEEHHHHSGSENYDEHIWLSPENAQKMITAIRDELSRIDPENAAYYAENADKYSKEIAAVAAETKKVISSSRVKTIVVADRNPYKYFTDYYGLHAVAAFAACSEDTDADLKTVLRLIEAVNENSLSAIFVTEMSNYSLANTVEENTRAKILTLHSYHNVSEEDFSNGKTYVDLMKENKKSLERGLR